MTREEMIKTVKSKMCKDCGIYLGGGKCSDKCNVIEIIKALEQEPCEDAVSRQAVLEQTYNWSKDEFLRVANPFDYLRKRINALQPVKLQEPKTGHWIDTDEGFSPCECSECESVEFIKSKFCPNCGARMESEE